jgi:hypothetical protein
VILSAFFKTSTARKAADRRAAAQTPRPGEAPNAETSAPAREAPAKD